METTKGLWRPALAYISHDMEDQQAKNDYVSRIANPAKEFGFPPWYLDQLESFRP